MYFNMIRILVNCSYLNFMSWLMTVTKTKIYIWFKDNIMVHGNGTILLSIHANKICINSSMVYSNWDICIYCLDVYFRNMMQRCAILFINCKTCFTPFYYLCFDTIGYCFFILVSKDAGLFKHNPIWLIQSFGI